MTVDGRLLATRVAQGDAAAFRSLVDLTRAPLYRLAARVVGDLAEAEDALQEAYVDAFDALVAGKWDGRSKIETWLYSIVTRRSLDALRRRREIPGDAAREPRFDGRVSAEARLALRELDGMLADLPPAERAALVLVAVEGLSARDAGEALGCSEGAVEQRLVRARAALRARTDREEGGGVGRSS